MRVQTVKDLLVMTEYLAASLLDMDYHTQTQVMEGNVQDFEKQRMSSEVLTDQIIPRYRSTYFNHIFSGGYSSGIIRIFGQKYWILMYSRDSNLKDFLIRKRRWHLEKTS